MQPNMPIQLQFLPASDTDCPARTKLMRASKAHWGYAPELLRQWEQELTIGSAHLAQYLVRKAMAEEQLVAFFSLAFAERRCYMENLFVNPLQMGKGYGKAMYREAVIQAKEQGALELWLRADPHATDFYLHMGMRQVGLAPGSAPGRYLPLMLCTLV